MPDTTEVKEAITLKAKLGKLANDLGVAVQRFTDSERGRRDLKALHERIADVKDEISWIEI